MSDSNHSTKVASLVCHSHVDMAISCLGSLQRFSSEPISFIIHDDGSLTNDDIDKIDNGLTVSRFVLRPEANEIVDELLISYPNCRRYRYEQPYSLKLLDIPLLSDGDMVYSDSATQA